ncbi:hypothetical protein DdX_05756 [Ditylenchus destructor]|uniref:Uncharacterized protein n=1 Tax=Ditylenchus destructor TaxID=166010 RepID=A0AAD4N9H2_9BILA|nr:hypothetical protein DdX_05756 [Ditylenchus destructor]
MLFLVPPLHLLQLSGSQLAVSKTDGKMSSTNRGSLIEAQHWHVYLLALTKEALDLLLASAHSIQQQLASVVSIKPSSLLPEILKHFNDNRKQKCEPRPS